MKDGKKWIYKRYEGKFAYFPIISTWHLVHGLFLIHGARKENCFSSSRAEYRSDELGNASISVPLRFLTLLALPDGYPANADVFVPSRIFDRISSIVDYGRPRREERRRHSICRLFIVRTRHPLSRHDAGWKGVVERGEKKKKMVRGRRGFNRELNGKLWSGLHNKTRSSEMVSSRWRRRTERGRGIQRVCSVTHARSVTARRRLAGYSLQRKSCWEIRFQQLCNPARIGLVYYRLYILTIQWKPTVSLKKENDREDFSNLDLSSANFTIQHKFVLIFKE